MSRAATDWAWSVQGISSSEKLTLLALADRADADNKVGLSIETVARLTKMNRKTIMGAIRLLADSMLIEDTGQRAGSTGQVVVYQLNTSQYQMKFPGLEGRGLAKRPVAISLREQVFFNHGKRCLACGTNQDITVDHVIPVSRGGSSHISNLQPLCRKCNSVKGISNTDYREGEA